MVRMSDVVRGIVRDKPAEAAKGVPAKEAPAQPGPAGGQQRQRLAVAVADGAEDVRRRGEVFERRRPVARGP